jgi:hypothetical protein
MLFAQYGFLYSAGLKDDSMHSAQGSVLLNSTNRICNSIKTNFVFVLGKPQTLWFSDGRRESCTPIFVSECVYEIRLCAAAGSVLDFRHISNSAKKKK